MDERANFWDKGHSRSFEVTVLASIIPIEPAPNSWTLGLDRSWIIGFYEILLRHARVRSAVPQYPLHEAGGSRASGALASARACWPGVRIHWETSSRGLNV